MEAASNTYYIHMQYIESKPNVAAIGGGPEQFMNIDSLSAGLRVSCSVDPLKQGHCVPFTSTHSQ